MKKLSEIKYDFRIMSLKRNNIKLTNSDFSLLASNCIGAFILHDLNLRFNSPTVNLFMYPSDFIKYVSNLKHYSNSKLIFKKGENTSYPIAWLDDVEIHFMHYKNEVEAKQKWLERTKRINFDNIFIMMTDRDGCTIKDLINFDQLPYKNKVVFTHKPYPEIKSAYYIKGFESQGSVGELFLYKSKLSIKRFYDDFNYVNWFNTRSY
ncbi:DUF1919 domain-containing protein [Bacillus sp. S3]|uniref:DUF1919 domain-containing protein n=1 Tax=Bacillus sp. S3 TaxID=486398 RepID=UPI0011880D71|nr:DUF1919 domain-containing protein [Bacillus sp. S3]QCJ44758.1 DUF1919 domain-containing protein [Bacillus sp. S3]